MHLLTISLVILSAAMHAGRNYLTKCAADKQAFVWWYEVVGLLLFTPLFLCYLPAADFTALDAWGFIVMSGIVHFFYWIFLTTSLESGDLSLVYPIMRASPALVLLFSVVFLDETVSLKGACGILLVALGSYTLNMRRFALSTLLEPLQQLVHDRATQFAFLTLLSVAAYSIVDKVAVSRMHPVVFAYAYPWISMLCYSAYLFRIKRHGQISREWQTHRKSILGCGVLSIFGYFLILLAFTLERVSYVVGLRQISIVFAVWLGGTALHEAHFRMRFASAAIIFVGTFLIATA